MQLTLRFNLRQSSPWLVNLLRLVDVALVTVLMPVLVWIFDALRGDHYTTLMFVSGAATLFIFHGCGLYRPRRGEFFTYEFLAILKAWTIVAGIVLLALFAFKVAHIYSRAVLLTWFFVCPMLVFVVHVLLRTALRRLRRKGGNQRMAVIVGAEEAGQALADYLNVNTWAGIRVLGFFDDRTPISSKPTSSPNVLGDINAVQSYLEKHPTDYLFIALPLSAREDIRIILDSCRTKGAQVYLLPDIFGYRLYNAQLEKLGDLLLLNFTPTFHQKRLFDVLFSFAVLVLCSPIIAAIALLIKLSDHGPVLFRHNRISASGKTFTCLKFRTMHTDAEARLKTLLETDPQARMEWESSFKLRQDPRITRIGRWLRRFSLDELPQFFNVLKGEMSVVGARPVVDKELNGPYQGGGGLYCSMKPGITGPWQVAGRTDTGDYAGRVSLDAWYAHNHSLWLDLRIIARTIVAVISGKGAY